jgi:6-phosphogluconolactonase (cycloisomerase 2 family)
VAHAWGAGQIRVSVAQPGGDLAVVTSDLAPGWLRRNVYSANRGDDSIAIFAVDEETGPMGRIDVAKTGGQGPREMNAEPSGRYPFCVQSAIE